jgi:hypothetical protein
MKAWYALAMRGNFIINYNARITPTVMYVQLVYAESSLADIPSYTTCVWVLATTPWCHVGLHGPITSRPKMPPGYYFTAAKFVHTPASSFEVSPRGG